MVYFTARFSSLRSEKYLEGAGESGCSRSHLECWAQFEVCQCKKDGDKLD